MRMKLLRILKNATKFLGRHFFIWLGLLMLTFVAYVLGMFDHTKAIHGDVMENTAGHKVRGIFDGISDNQTQNDYLSSDLSLKSPQIIRNIISDASNVAYPLFVLWKNDKNMYCNNKISVYGKTMFRAKDIVLNTDFIYAKADPRIDLQSAFGQKAEDEHYSFELGAFQIVCPRILPYFAHAFHDDSDIPHFAGWYRSIISRSKQSLSPVEVISKRVYASVRYEYTNVYWVIVDMYNVFIHCIFNGHNPSEVTVLLMDAHPRSPLDDLWKVVFGKVICPVDLPKVTLFKDLTWTISRSFSPFTSKDKLTNIPYIRHFRQFFLTQFYLSEDILPLNCTSLRVTFVWRRDYISHPRNPEGVITRKIENEADVLNKIREAFPNWKVRGHQLDALSIFDQIRILSQTDILVGMHGAAMAFSFLLAPGSGVIELYPKYYHYNDHMKRIAESSGLVYLHWMNDNDALENIYRKTTLIPPEVLTKMLGKMSQKMCAKPRRHDFKTPINKKSTKKPQKDSTKPHVIRKTINKIKH